MPIVIRAPNKAEHIVFESDSLPELFREVSDWLEYNDADPWAITVDTVGDDGMYQIHIYRCWHPKCER